MCGYVCAHAMAWVLRSENSSLELVLSCYVGSGAPTRFVSLCLICLCQLSRPSAGPCAPFEVLLSALKERAEISFAKLKRTLTMDWAALDTDKQKQKRRQKVLVSALGELRLSSTQGWRGVTNLHYRKLSVSVVLGCAKKRLSHAVLEPQGLVPSKVRREGGT